MRPWVFLAALAAEGCLGRTVQRHATSAAFRRLRVERELPARAEPYPCPCWPGKPPWLAEAVPRRCAGSSSYIRWYHTGMDVLTIRRCHPRPFLRILLLAVMLSSCATAPAPSVESATSVAGIESPVDCRGDADCRLHRVFTCAEIRSCSASCPGAGHWLSLPVKSPAPAEPSCGLQPPCTPSCPTLSLSSGAKQPESPHPGCRDLRCVVLPEGASH
jgi:hypothetical protein